MIGESLGHFRVTAKLGEGGMGEVYRAQDTKLGRDVALKVLPEAVSGDANRMARFAREAQLLASLNHPNIAAIYGVEEAGERRALVMELVEGDTLAEKIARGPMPVEEVARLALQIAAALESAHDKGIVHRDLKPANVKLTPQGDVKVLDFGLAKALEDEPGEADIAHSPTITAAATQAGIILGTAAYMSPEQAAGSPADRRSDIWSFGVVLTEMLTGRMLFQGQTVSHVLAGVLKDEPDWDKFPTDVPGRVLDLLRRCLRKDPRQRLQAIGDARVLLEEYVADPRVFDSRSEALQEAPGGRRQRTPWVVAALLAVALAGSWWSLWPQGAKLPTRAQRFSIELEKEATLFRRYGSSIAISPDGTRIAYVYIGGQNKHELYVRELNQWESRLLVQGTGENRPYQPFFSPDSQWVGFVTPSNLKKVPFAGGTPITLCEVAFARGASWTEDGAIVFTPNPTAGLSRVPAAGGEPESLTQWGEEDGDTSHRWPQVLPGGRAVLFTSSKSAANFSEASIEVLELESGTRKVVHRGGSYARYIRSGHLVYVNGATLFALPFDIEALEPTGSAVPVIENLGAAAFQGSAQFDISSDGTLVYVEKGGREPASSIVWVDRQGKSTPLWGEKRNFRRPRISPDGTRVAVEIRTEGQSDIWVYDMVRDVATRLTFDDGRDANAVWTPDGESIVFGSEQNGVANLYRKAADGSGTAERLTESDRMQWPTSISSDGSVVTFVQIGPQGPDLWLLPEDGEAVPFLETPAVDVDARISPDGRWIAYASLVSGTMETYVRPVSGQGKWQISSGGGSWPVWSDDGKQLFFWNDEETTAFVRVETDGDRFRASRVETLFPSRPTLQNSQFDVSSDAERFVMLEGEPIADAEGHEHVRVILDWFAELERTFSDVGL
jgi:serine/threonine-protein kinase